MRQRSSVNRFFTRREFINLSTATLAIAASSWKTRAQETPEKLTAMLSVDSATQLATLPPDFTGLSYESAQLANPLFFSAKNKQLIALFRELSPHGVLRLGGGTSEFTTFSETAPSGPPPFEVFGPDTSKTDKTGTVTSAFALENLRGFLDATGWSCLYGLNMGQGTKENAAAEAAAAHRILGPRLFALQIGNEPDSFRNRYRPQSYGPDDFVREWNEFHDAIVARTPGLKFAGADISNKLTFLTAFAAETVKHPDVILLTGHYYAMGPAGKPEATLDNLLSADPKSTTLKWRDLPVIEDAMHSAHLPFRVSEANSCWNGGQAGVSDVFGSALWCADAMLHFATLGFSGINLHGGGNGIYSPIVGSPSSGFTRRPEFFGMQFAQRCAGCTLLHTTLKCDSDRVTAYAARTPHAVGGVDQLAIINKTSARVELHLGNELFDGRRLQIWSLSGPSLHAQSDIQFAEKKSLAVRQGLLSIDPYSAVLLNTK